MKRPRGWVKLGLFPGSIFGVGGVMQKTKDGFICGPLAGFALCKDCGVSCGWSGEFFQLRNHVWEQAWPGTAQRSSAKDPLPMEAFLCIGCTEQRLGRKLTRRDFDMRRLINQLPWLRKKKAFMSKRMLDRLQRRGRRPATPV